MMKFFKCPTCGKMISIMNDVKVPTICCGKPMEEVVANSTDGAKEKHVPVFEVKDNIVTVTVGSINHPMMEEHHIEWIMLATNLGRQRKVLNPLGEPRASFALLPGEEVLEVYEYCNLHGLFKA